MKESVYPEDRDRIRIIYSSLTLPDKIKEYDTEMDWQLSMFDHVPIVAAAALFTSISNDIRASEAQALEVLLSRVKVPPFIINKIEPMAFAPSSYLKVGDSMNIRVMIAANDSTQVNAIRFAVNDSAPSAYQSANGAIPVRATAPGEYTLFGQISIKEKGIEKWKPWQYRYTVGQPQGVVTNEDFTIIYEGYDHTFSASVSGYPQENISLSVPGAIVVSAGNGKFKVKMGVNNVGRQVVSTITVRTEQGMKSMPGPKFLVKKLPKPEAFFGSIGGEVSEITVAQLRANINAGVRASYGPDVPLDPSKVRYSVTGFELEVIVNGQPVRKTSTSGQFTTDMKNISQAIRPGMRLNITNIRASGPTGPVRL